MLRKTVDAVGLMVIINSAILCVLCFVACDALAVAATSTATAAKKNEYCSPSSCGNIKNIHYPFRLKGDPRINCGDPRYELACENNRTVLYLHQGRYYVEEISYENRTIRVVDSGLEDDNCSSMPRYSLSRFTFSDRGEPYEFAIDQQRNWNYWFQVAHLSCEAPVRRVGCGRDHSSSDEYCVLDMSPCINGSVDSSIASWQKHYSYALVGYLFRIWEIPDSCSVNLFVPVVLDDLSTNRELIALEKLENFSFHYIHHRMAMGFPLWFRIDCSDCEATGGYCDMSGVSDKSNPNCIYFGCRSAFQSFSCFFHYLFSFFGGIFLEELNIISDFDKRNILMGNVCLGIFVMAGFIISARNICGIMCFFPFLIYKLRRRHLSMDESIEDLLQSHNNLMPIRYSYSSIKKVTKGFKEKLGQGGYGSVFKGKLKSGHHVAIKMLDQTKGNGQDFINEVATIGRIHHVNVVQLIGFCSEGSKRALIYEFMPNGSLDKYISARQEENIISLSWEKMLGIVLGVGRGIEYLHRGCNIQILHFDIKPHNILLDENFVPKISDFGLAKFFSTDDSIVSLTAAPRGTIGYIAPEMIYKNIGGVSNKADVYSFGMLLLEITGRKKAINALRDHSSQFYFPSWIYDRLCHGEDIEIGDATDDEKTIAKKLVIVALWCIQMNPVDRPSMSKVVDMLEDDIEVLQMPPRPFLSSPELPIDDTSFDTSHSETSTTYPSESQSCNSVASSTTIIKVKEN